MPIRTLFLPPADRPVSSSAPPANPYLAKPQRNLNNAFAYDLVPSPSVLSAALRAARRVNDFPTAVRIFEGTPPILFSLRDISNQPPP